jgi:hypothetical protein
MTVEERFWSHVDKNGPVIRPELGPCWIWRSSLIKGYGAITVARKTVKAHRLSYVLAGGKIEPGKLLRHKCHTPSCVNPIHLVPGTTIDNAEDMLKAGRCTSVTISDDTVREIRRLATENGVRPYMIARQFGLKFAAVSRIIRGERRRVLSEISL